jgi:prepilin-type N-terminal cleavage/methylation domain-containing protein
MKSSSFYSAARGGFSLVEVSVAIGIFAFVAVGILGLLPAAMKIRADSAQETFAVMIAQQLFASIDAAPSLTNVAVPTGAYSGNPPTMTNNFNEKASIVLGYLTGTSFPFWSYWQDPGSSWTNNGGTGAQIVESAQNNIAAIARLSITNASPADTNLVLVTVEVRSPVSIALSNSRPSVFTTLRARK